MYVYLCICIGTHSSLWSGKQFWLDPCWIENGFCPRASYCLQTVAGKAHGLGDRGAKGSARIGIRRGQVEAGSGQCTMCRHWSQLRKGLGCAQTGFSRIHPVFISLEFIFAHFSFLSIFKFHFLAFLNSVSWKFLSVGLSASLFLSTNSCCIFKFWLEGHGPHAACCGLSWP